MEHSTEIQTIINTLKEFLLGSVSDNLTDTGFWDNWEFSQFKYGTPCWELMKCQHKECKYNGGVVPKKCWLAMETPCCAGISYMAKIKKCINCPVVKQYSSYPIRELYELISLLIKFMKLRDAEMFTAATKDGLTGVYNRLYFEDFIKHQLSIAERYHEQMSVILLDLDKFKLINDTYGHLVGDGVLREVAARLRAAVRDVDVVGRYGGEEFMVVVHNTPLVTAQEIAERVCVRVASTPIQLQNVAIDITVSVGLAEVSEADTASSFMDRADHALYLAKDRGRNRVVVADPL